MSLPLFVPFCENGPYIIIILYKSCSFSCFPFVNCEAGQILVIFHPILLFRHILLLNFGRFSNPIVLLIFCHFPRYTIIPPYSSTCQGQPPLVQSKSGPSWQVAPRHRERTYAPLCQIKHTQTHIIQHTFHSKCTTL